MEVKDPFRQKRNEHMRRLQESDSSHLYPEIKSTIPPIQENPLYDPNWTRKMEDPEFAWHQRNKLDPNRYGGGFVGERQKRLSPSSFRKLGVKLIISVLLFAMIWVLFHFKLPWADKGRQWVVASLTQTMDFQAISVWYEEKFGDSPSFIPSFQNREGVSAIRVSTEKRTYFTPVQGKISTPFDASHSGLQLQTEADVPVYALDTGQVIFAGVKEATGFTVIIRHPLGLQSVYGRLSESRVEVNDWIKGGEPIGKVAKEEGSAGSLFFAMKKDDRFIDPTDVIPFD